MKPAFKLLGQRFGRLVVTERLPNVGGYTAWACGCDCGKRVSATGVALKWGKKRSCGCLLVESRKTACRTHGKSKTPTHSSWASMIQRCTNPRQKAYADYGARGIKVCERWRDFSAFLADMGERPAGTTLDRFPNRTGNYEPGNCRWATKKEQSENSATPRLITHKGKTQNVTEWARELGMKPDTLHMRLFRGWSIEEALTP